MKTILKVRSTDDQEFRFEGNSVELRNKTYNFDKVVFDSNQNILCPDIYPIVDKVATCKDTHHAIIAYGCTSSGKTHTMQNMEDGVIPCAIGHLFDQCQGKLFQFKLRCVEVYMEKCRDLLATSTPLNLQSHLYSPAMRILGTPGMNVESGLSRLSLENADQTLEILHSVFQSRQVSATNANDKSSRSHLLIFVDLILDKVPFSRLIFGDLAGSERFRNTGLQGLAVIAHFIIVDVRHKQEAGAINKSLHTFHNVIHAIREKRPHVPIRDSKLTSMLAKCLTGSGDLTVLVTISPESRFMEETVHVLEFGAIVKQLEPYKAKVDTGIFGNWSVKKRLDFRHTPTTASGSESPVPARLSSPSGFDSSIDKILNERENYLRNQLMEEYAENSDRLRELYESMLEEAVAETEEKFNRKMDVLARSYESELAEMRSKVKYMEKTVQMKETMIKELREERESSQTAFSADVELSDKISKLLQEPEDERKYRAEMHDRELETIRKENQLRMDECLRDIEKLKKQILITDENYRRALLDADSVEEELQRKDLDIEMLNKRMDDLRLQLLKDTVRDDEVNMDEIPGVSPIRCADDLIPEERYQAVLDDDTIVVGEVCQTPTGGKSVVFDQVLSATPKASKANHIAEETPTVDHGETEQSKEELPTNTEIPETPSNKKSPMFSKLGLKSAFKLAAPKARDMENKENAQEGTKKKIKLRKKRANFLEIP